MPKTAVQDVLLANIRALIAENEDSTYSLAKRSGLAQSTISNILSGRHNIAVAKLEAIAGAYGLEAWQLLLPDITKDSAGARQLSSLVQDFLHTSATGREYITRVAERESHYGNEPTP